MLELHTIGIESKNPFLAYSDEETGTSRNFADQKVLSHKITTLMC